MIRIACHVQDYYFEIIKKYFVAKDYYLEKFNSASYDDIYFIEINSLNDLDKIHQINKYPETLIYIIGPKDFHLLNECLTLGVHLYFENDNLENSLYSKSEAIHQQIFSRFKTYHYKNKQMSFELRLAQIMYVEFIERKNLSSFIKEIDSNIFIQIHKSFVINKNFIKEIKAKELILKDSTILPIGRNFKESI